MADYSLTGLFSSFSGANGTAGYAPSYKNSGYRNFSAPHSARHTEKAQDREADRHPVERRSFDITLNHVGRHHVRSGTEAGETEAEDEAPKERDFHPFRNHGQRRSTLAFFDNLMRRLVKVFAIKILSDFLTALKGGASLDQLALDESKTDIAEATENEDSVVTVKDPAEQEDGKSAPSLLSLSVSVGFQIDITIGQPAAEGGLLSSQTLQAKNPVVYEGGGTTDLVA